MSLRASTSLPTLILAAILLPSCGGLPAAAPSSAPSQPVVQSSAATAPSNSATPSASPASASASSAAAVGSASQAAASTGVTPSNQSPSLAASGKPAGGTTIAVGQNSSKLDIKMREVLAGNTITTDATESTQAVTGSIMLDGSGSIAPGSKITMDLTTLKSDRSTRDNFIKGRFVLDTGNFPTVEFVPTEVQGLGGPPPDSGSKTFKLLGNATAHGITKPMNWDVNATFDGQGCSGQATSTFKLSDFGLKIPQLPTVVSVEDQGNLALTFQASKASA